MMAVPFERPVTIPVGSTVPTAVLLLLQCPPGVESDKVLDPPAHTLVVPLIGLTANDTIEMRHSRSVRVNSLIIDQIKKQKRITDVKFTNRS